VKNFMILLPLSIPTNASSMSTDFTVSIPCIHLRTLFPKTFPSTSQESIFLCILYLSVSLTLVCTRRKSLSFLLSFSFCLNRHPNVSSDALLLWVCKIARTGKTWKNNMIGREREWERSYLTTPNYRPPRLHQSAEESSPISSTTRNLTTKKNLARRKQTNLLFPLLQRIESLHGKLALNYMERNLIRRLRNTVRVKCFELYREKRKRRQHHREGKGDSMRERFESVCKNKTKQNSIKIAVSGNARQLSILDRQQCGQSPIDNSVVHESDKFRSSSSNGSPAALSRYYVTVHIQISWTEVKTCRFGSAKWFWPSIILHNLLRLVRGAAKLNTCQRE
jgi:hypothetical protein